METLQQAVIINNKEELLLIKCGKAFGKELVGMWEFPNVFLDPDKKSMENLQEGIKEIVGSEIDVIYQFFTGMLREGEGEFLNVGFLCRLKGAGKVKIHEEYNEFKWVKPADVKKLKVTNVQVVEMAEKAMKALESGGEE